MNRRDRSEQANIETEHGLRTDRHGGIPSSIAGADDDSRNLPKSCCAEYITEGDPCNRADNRERYPAKGCGHDARGADSAQTSSRVQDSDNPDSGPEDAEVVPGRLALNIVSSQMQGDDAADREQSGKRETLAGRT